MSFATRGHHGRIGGERDRRQPTALAVEPADQLGHEVLRVGCGAAVAERQQAASGEQALREAAADLDEPRRALGEETLLQRRAVRDDPQDVVGVHPTRIMQRAARTAGATDSERSGITPAE